MENLWKKESNRPKIYVNPFKGIDEEYVEQVFDWLRQPNRRRLRHKIVSQPIPHDRQLRKRKLTAPIEVPHKQRKVAPKHGNERKGFNRKAPPAFSPKLSFARHNQFPDIAKVLDVKHDAKFGRHFIANRNIDVGEIIAVGRPFAEAVVCYSSSKKFYCLTCKKIGTDFIGCDNCADVKFCSKKCRSLNHAHQLECNSIYHRIESLEIKLAIQMVLNAIQGFSNADDLIRYFEKLLANNSLCQNGLILSLTKSSREDNILRAYKAYQCLMNMKSINNLFNSERTKRFLAHLVLHYLAIIPTNVWDSELNDEKNFAMRYIYGAMSLFNHNCAPNAFYSIKDNYGYCLTVRPIKKGEQIFVNYLGDRVEESKANRQSYIKREWGFVCDCERCKPKSRRFDTREMVEDPSWEYINSHFEDYLFPLGSNPRNRLRDECANFLRRHGNNWTKTLDNVIKLFILAITHEKR
ncbi:SET and MYND domain-containing protein DDB_G0273591-like [Sitodiplosis mosellana]|uniref:SET and MYND domain-containing protein DDB_G0273591-like n=1 Tax=Sitodiplosis mosellana TaxID=263140 RepID=UPI002443FAEF|nr:SET and MYND domain-containing protein DDB_G0273591-like [Sitodiplosis mosellana]